MEFLCPWGNDIVSRLFGSVVLSPILSTQEPLEMETQPATESQVALSLGGTPTPVSPSSVPSSAGKLAEQEVFCLHQQVKCWNMHYYKQVDESCH